MCVCVLVRACVSVCVSSSFCVQNNSNCTLATKAEMWRETTRKGVEEARGGRTEGAWKGRSGAERKGQPAVY